MKHFMLMLLFALCALTASAQSKSVSGTVRDVNGNPLPGVAIVIPGTTAGTVTDFDGRYTIKYDGDVQTLNASFIGMKDGIINVAAGQTDIVLEDDSQDMEEVVVVAYGTSRREAKTGALATVKADELADVPTSSVDKMLGGKMAGVMVTSQSGQPGSATSIRVRGTSSINAGNEPLYVVDGVAIMTGDQSIFTNSSNALSALNPDDIESLTVLKDAAATSVYGSRAANGVVIITTKSGRMGKSTVSARGKMGVSQLANDNDYGVMSAEELLDFQRTAAINAGHNPDDPNDTYYKPYTLLEGPLTNWMDHLTRTGKLYEVEVSATGGNEKTTYYSSVNFHKNEGIFYGVDFYKFTARVNADHQINEYFKTGARVSGAYTKMNDVPMQSLYYSNPIFAGSTIMPWELAYTEDGLHNIDIPSNSDTNPRATAEYDEQSEKQWRANASLYLQCEPIPGLVIKTLDACEYTFGYGRRYWSAYTNYDYPELQTSSTRYSLLTTSNTITYERNFLEKHYARLLVGQEATKRYYDYIYLYSGGVKESIPYPSTSTQDEDEGDYYVEKGTMLSFFGILDYNFDSRYYLQGSFRRDGSSKFGKDKRWGSFWSLGLSWNVSNESFLSDVEWLDFLKIRASYGVNGNDNIDDYMAYGTYTTVSYNGITGMRQSNPANNDLSWETNKSLNLGFDFTFFKDYTINFDIYKRTTEDMLLDKPVSYTTGFGSNTMNIGEVENKGIELQLAANIIHNKTFTWNVSANIAWNKSEITDLAGESSMSYSVDSRIHHIKGERLMTFYLRDYYGVNPSNGEALFVAEDGSLTNNYNNARYVKAGSPEPKYTGGLSTDFSWKGLTLSAQLEFKGGNKVLLIEKRYTESDGNQMSMNQDKIANNYWKKPGDTGCAPKPVAGNTSNSYSYNTTRFLEDGDYTRIKDVTLSYSLPRNIVNKAKMQNVRVYVSGLNVYTFHNVNFWDPERGADGIGYGIYPVSKTFVAGIDLSF